MKHLVLLDEREVQALRELRDANNYPHGRQYGVLDVKQAEVVEKIVQHWDLFQNLRNSSAGQRRAPGEVLAQSLVAEVLAPYKAGRG